MKAIMIATMSVCATTVLLAGCGPPSVRGPTTVQVNHSSPKAVVRSFHAAIEELDHAAMVECMAPDEQADFGVLLALAKALDEKAKRLRRLVEERIGEEEADQVVGNRGVGVVGSPLGDVIVDGDIDWGRVRLEERGEEAEFFVEGRPWSACKVTRIRGEWYVTQGFKAGFWPKEIDDDSRRRWLGWLIDIAEMLYQKVKNGSVNKENWYDFLATVPPPPAGEVGTLEAVPPPIRGSYKGEDVTMTEGGSWRLEIRNLGGPTSLLAYRSVRVEKFDTSLMRGAVPRDMLAEVRPAIQAKVAELEPFAGGRGAKPVLVIRGRFLNYDPGGSVPGPVELIRKPSLTAQIELVDGASNKVLGTAMVTGMFKSALRPGAKELANGMAKAVKGLLEAHMKKPE